MPARQLNQSFAVVQVADYEGLTVFVDNQPVGRTDAQGRVLVEALRPYENNEISVDPTQVPMDGSLAQSEIARDAGLSQRSAGALPGRARHGCDDARRAGRRHAGPGGRNGAASARRRFPVALDGLLYVEGLRETTQVRIDWNGGQCTLEARRPAGSEPIPDLGDLRCK